MSSSIDRRSFLKAAGAASLFSLAPTALSARKTDGESTHQAPPNVVFILVDDLGWKDLGCYGNEVYDTPHIDRLAQDGVRFTNAYAAAPNCSPTRASLLTGQAPARLHLTDYLPGRDVPHAPLTPPDKRDHLPHEVPTIAERLGRQGYASASIGKWHLGSKGSLPTDHGFDVGFAGAGAGHQERMFPPYEVPDVEARSGEYLTDRLNREALRFIEANQDRPFFLYLPHYAVHRPHEAKKELLEKYRRRLGPEREQQAVYAAMVEALDQSTGRIVEKLRELGELENTLLVFTSDNGPTDVSPPEPLRAGKGTLYEGGIRVPLIIAGPDVSSRTSETPVITHDVCATALAGAGLSTASLDGRPLQPLLSQAASMPDRALHWHFPHYSWREQLPAGALRKGRYKLIEFYGCDRLELYDLEEDVGETQNLASEMPDRARRLQQELVQWREEVEAQMPTPNPQHDPSKSSVPSCEE